MGRHTSTIPDGRYTASSPASEAVSSPDSGFEGRIRAGRASVVKIGGSMGWWTRGTVCCASIVVLAWCSAGLVLRLAGPEPDGPAASGTAGADRLAGRSAPGPRPRQSFSPVFGAATAAGAARPIPVARNTAYSLRGLLTMRDGHEFAVIESSGATAVYRERDRLPGGETVAEIGTGSVTLSGPQGLVRLAFEDPEIPPAAPGGTPGAVPADPPAPAARRPEAEPSSAIRAAAPVRAAAPEVEPERRPPVSRADLDRRVLSAEVLSAARFTRVRARSGKIGLRIKWLRRDELTDAIGLRRGDVILAVNGLSVDDPEARDELLGTLSTGREIVIDLERRNGPHRLVIPLSHG